MKVRSDGRWHFDQLEGFFGWSNNEWKQVMKTFVGYMNVMDPPSGTAEFERDLFDPLVIEPYDENIRRAA